MDFNNRKEIIFICYEDILKSSYTFLLKKIRDELLPYYKAFIHTSNIENVSDKHLTSLAMQRTTNNLIDYLAIAKFDTKDAWEELRNRYKNMYKESPNSKIHGQIDFLSVQKFVQNIYIYTEKYDKRVEECIAYDFKDISKIHYVSGAFQLVLDNIPQPTTFMLNDIKMINTIKSKNKLEFTEILLPVTGINMEINHLGKLAPKLDLDILCKENNCKIGMFMPFDVLMEGEK